MCTIMTFSNEFYLENQIEVDNQILLDSISNNDGTALLLINKDGAVCESLKTFNIGTVIRMLEHSNYTRAFIHQRAATQGQVSIQNIHGWSYRGGVHVMHNGVLSSPEAKRYPVDSMLIGEHLNKGIEHALEFLKTETFANVMLIDPKNVSYHIHRSWGGTLFTDKAGNFSTNEIGAIDYSVACDTYGSYLITTGEAFVEVGLGNPKSYLQDIHDYWYPAYSYPYKKVK